MAHEVPALPYPYNALEPFIDEKTMQLHHDMHHGAYVKNLNAALEKHSGLQSRSPEDLIRDLNAVPEDIRAAVRNNAGGHINHTMYWKIMKPKGGGDPTGDIAQALTRAFGPFKDFQKKFNEAGSTTKWQSLLQPTGEILLQMQRASSAHTIRDCTGIPSYWVANAFSR